MTFVLALSVSSCGTTSQRENDAPVARGDEKGDQTPAEIIAMPDGFSNVATKCDKYGNRIYTGVSIFILPADPTCKPVPQ